MSSFLNENGQWLTSLMDNKNIEKHPQLTLWEIKAPQFSLWMLKDWILSSSNYEDRKQAVLGKILHNFPRVFLSYSEDPVEDGLKGKWVKASQRTWVIPQDSDLAEVYEWLRLGNWLLYVSEEVADVQAFRNFGDCDAFMRFMKQASMGLAISAFFDNDPWVIGVNTVVLAIVAD